MCDVLIIVQMSNFQLLVWLGRHHAQKVREPLEILCLGASYTQRLPGQSIFTRIFSLCSAYCKTVSSHVMCKVVNSKLKVAAPYTHGGHMATLLACMMLAYGKLRSCQLLDW